MNELNTPKSANGFIYTIKSIETAIIKCPSSCFYMRNKDYHCSTIKKFRQLDIKYHNGSFECLKITINAKNTGKQTNWHVGAEDALIVDNDGFTYRGVILCEECLPPRISENNTYILPQTQVDYIQIFPTMEIGVEIAKIKVNIGGTWTDFALNDTPNNTFDTIQAIPSENTKSSAIERYIYEEELRNRWIAKRNFTERLNKIKTSIYSRLNNSLTELEQVKIENKIKNDIYNIRLDLQTEPDANLDEIRNEVQNLENEYINALNVQNNIEKSRKQIIQKVDELLELSPRDFEQYIGELFNHLGYIVEVTPYSNDKGLDIIMYKDNVKYGVQCKRYKGSVGSPEIQTFIGALSHAEADKGFFVTTGMFSFEAEKMANKHPIQLINKIDLAKLILEALND